MECLSQHFIEHRLYMHNTFPEESKVAKQTLVFTMESIMYSSTLTKWSTILTDQCNKLKFWCGELKMEHWRLTQELLWRSLDQHKLPLWLHLLALPQSHSPTHLQDPACKNTKVTELPRKTKPSRHNTSEYYSTEYYFRLHVTVVIIITLLSADPILNKTLGLRPSLQENIWRWKPTFFRWLCGQMRKRKLFCL